MLHTYNTSFSQEAHPRVGQRQRSLKKAPPRACCAPTTARNSPIHKELKGAYQALSIARQAGVRLGSGSDVLGAQQSALWNRPGCFLQQLVVQMMTFGR